MLLRYSKIYILIVIFATICYKEVISSSYRDRVIGCLFTDICTEDQFCFDDNAFGRCEDQLNINNDDDDNNGLLPSNGRNDENNYVYQLDRKTLQLLENELNRLNDEGYEWKDLYTQCTLKTILNDRPRIVYDPTKCDHLRIKRPNNVFPIPSVRLTSTYNSGQFADSILPLDDTASIVTSSPTTTTSTTTTSSPKQLRRNKSNKQKEQQQKNGEISFDPFASSYQGSISSTPSTNPKLNDGNNVKLSDNVVKDTIRAKHIKRNPTIWFGNPNINSNSNGGNIEDNDNLNINDRTSHPMKWPESVQSRKLDNLVQMLITQLDNNKINENDDDNRNEDVDIWTNGDINVNNNNNNNNENENEWEALEVNPIEMNRDEAINGIIRSDVNTNLPSLPLLERNGPSSEYRSTDRINRPFHTTAMKPTLTFPMETLFINNNDNDVRRELLNRNGKLSQNQYYNDDQLLPTIIDIPEIRVLRSIRNEDNDNVDTENDDDDDDNNNNNDNGNIDEFMERFMEKSYPDETDEPKLLMVDVVDTDADDDNPQDAELIQMIWNKDMNNDDSNDRDDNFVDTLIDQNEEETDNDKVDNDVKEMLLSDINYNNNYDQKMPNFYREHRYDIKKPGPRFLEEYFFKPDNTDNNDVDQSIISAAISTNNDDNVDDDDEIMDEKKKNDGKTWHGTEPMLIKKQKEKPESTNNEKMIRSNKPVSEGPVKVDSKSENTIIIRSAEEGEVTNLEAIDSTHTYVITDRVLGEEDSQKFIQTLEQVFHLPRGTFSNIRKEDFQLTFKVNPNYRDLNASQIASRIEDLSVMIKQLTGYDVKETGIGDKTKLPVVSPEIIKKSNERLVNLTLLICSAILASISATFVIYMFRRNAYFREKMKGLVKISEDWLPFDYQILCRQHMKSKTEDKTSEDVNGNKMGDEESGEGAKPKPKNVDTNLANQQQSGPDSQSSPPSRSSTSSWVEEPVLSNMDIKTGHIILSYMEDHLKKKDRLEKEWEALCAYEADPCSVNAASEKQNAGKNRYPDILPYDHSRVILNDLANGNNSDYINANTITDHDPRNPAYIVTQGPLSNTKADFWQMIWEQGSVIIVMLTRLRENGLNMCDRYWPEEGSEIYQNYEIHLVSEHIWCDDYLVRSFYLKNLKTGETRTVTQFHFLSWPENGIPPSTKSILEYRRKVNKSYKGRSCPIVVHCSDGIGRTGTYILIDMVLNRLSKGAKEIDIAATLEHIRDQRSGMVKNKAQFEYVLLAVAEEVQAILKALAPN